MKKLFTIFAAAAVLLCSCKDDNFQYETKENTGILSLDRFSVSLDSDVLEMTKAVTEASDNYSLILKDSDGTKVWEKTYSEVKAEIAASASGGISLKAGSYTLEIRSTVEEVPAAGFDAPVYGCTKPITIEVGKTTSLGAVVCTLLQCAVEVRYNADFMTMVTGDGACTIEVTAGSPLEYALNYNGGSPTYDTRRGYFAVNNGSNTSMAITFKGALEGKIQKMKTSVAGIKPQELHIVTFMKKLDETGNASFSVLIDGLIADSELVNDVKGEEEGDGNDPNAPIGDGGIQLVSTCSYDITQPVIVPKTGSFQMTMQAIIPNGARKFTVDIASTNADFINSVNTVGGTTLDLINPSEAALGVFTIVPFPHGSELQNATSIDFNLSEAQTPLLGFVGTHTFTMNVTDNKGCKKSIDVVLVVE
ncbi:MAG: DUF4493 domain-containing protein [Bacteroidales bacterium]|nr:DUF4493 domain-containing protein [Bacteroidales bacterium]